MYRIKEIDMLCGGTVTFYSKFKSFQECLDYCVGAIEYNRIIFYSIKLEIYKNKTYVGSWESKEYKNANKTKTSNL